MPYALSVVGVKHIVQDVWLRMCLGFWPNLNEVQLLFCVDSDV